ncbi:MAG: buk2 4, partial [Sporomusa sp.]|nr:buk2 4 [Sporomusa sp.]
MAYQILTINPGSTSTKIGLYHDTNEIFAQNIIHSTEALAQFSTIIDQFTYRLEKIYQFMATNNVEANDFAAVVG